MSRRNKYAFIAFGVTVALAALVASVLTVWTQAPGKLLDGTQVVLEKVSYGTNQTCPQAFLEAFLRHLPAAWLGRIHWNPSSGNHTTSTHPIFTFWLKFSSLVGAKQAISYAIADENGFEAPMIFEGSYSRYSPGGFSNNRDGLVRGTGTFPHRSRKFFLRLYEQAGNGERLRVAEFKIQNAAFQNYMEWKPQELPIAQRTNDLVFSLVKAEVGVTPPGAILAPYDLQAGRWSELRFRVSAQGGTPGGWSVKEMNILDATGQQLRISAEDLGAFNHEFSRSEGDEIVCLHRWEFWPEEPAWRLSVHFERAAGPGCWIDYLIHPKFLSEATNSGKNAEPR